MTQIENALKYFVANYEILIAIWQGLFIALSTLCALVGWTRASKVFGTFAAVDGGRLVRYARRALVIRKALSGLLLVGLVVACSGAHPQMSQVCPIPSGWVRALPTPAEVANAADKGKTVVQQVEAVTEDPTVSGLVVVAGTVLDALDSVAPICTELASAPCDDTIAQSREILASGEARRKEVCQVVALLVAVVPVERVTAELVAAQEMCR
jgi:hypothetical protein